MSRIRLCARNLAANWTACGAIPPLMLLTSWFVFHLLGDIQCGVVRLADGDRGFRGFTVWSGFRNER